MMPPCVSAQALEDLASARARVHLLTDQLRDVPGFMAYTEAEAAEMAARLRIHAEVYRETKNYEQACLAAYGYVPGGDDGAACVA